MNRTSYNG